VQTLARALVMEGHHVEVVHCEDAYHLRGVGARRIAERYTLIEGADDAPPVVPVPLSMNSEEAVSCGARPLYLTWKTMSWAAV